MCKHSPSNLIVLTVNVIEKVMRGIAFVSEKSLSNGDIQITALVLYIRLRISHIFVFPSHGVTEYNTVSQ